MAKRAKRKVRSEVMWMAWRKDSGFLPNANATTKAELLHLISVRWLGDEGNCVRVKITELPRPKSKRRVRK